MTWFWGKSGSHWIKFSQSSSKKYPIRLYNSDMWSYFYEANGLYAQAFSLFAVQMESCFWGPVLHKISSNTDPWISPIEMPLDSLYGPARSPPLHMIHQHGLPQRHCCHFGCKQALRSASSQMFPHSA